MKARKTVRWPFPPKALSRQRSSSFLEGAVAGRVQPTAIVVLLYTVALVAAEAMVVFGGVTAGIVCDALLLGVLWTHYVLASCAPERSPAAGGSQRKLHPFAAGAIAPAISFLRTPSPPFLQTLPALALLPLLRILSLTMPVSALPQVTWYALIGVPLLLGTAMTARLLDLSAIRLGLRLRGWWPSQPLIALSGLPLAVVAVVLVRPAPLSARMDLRGALAGALILLIFTGFTEELVFRGVLQHVAVAMFGRAGLVWSSALFALMHLGSLSPGYVLFMLLVGLFFAWCVDRTGSLWGVAVAHGFLVIGTLLVIPK